MKENIISLSKFLSRYYFIKGEKLKNLTHSEAKTLFPQLKHSSNEMIISNPSLLYMGKIVLVSDGRQIIPYETPTLEQKDYEELNFEREDDKPFEKDDTVYDYAKMSVFELRCLLIRKFNSNRNQKCARHELNKRGVVLRKKYKRERLSMDDMEEE